MPTLSPDATIPSGVARRLLSERGHRDYVGPITDEFFDTIVNMPYPSRICDQYAWNAESRALSQWLTAQREAGQGIDFTGISLDFDVVPWCYGKAHGIH